MNKEKELLERYNIRPRKIGYRNKTKIIETNQGKYTLKVKKAPNLDIYRYLDNHNFQNYLSQINDPKDPYEIYTYIEEETIDKETKAIDLIYTLSLLHNKTTTYQDVNLDTIKSDYESLNNKIDYLFSYYYDLQDYIENKVYMSPSEYLLIRNINLIYISLTNAKRHLEEWYQIKQKQKQERRVFLHNDLSLSHFLKRDSGYLINWKKSHQGSPIYDFISLYQNEYENLEMESLFSIYQSKYKYTKDERLLFNTIIELPWKLSFKDNNYINTINVECLLDYLSKTNQFISKEYEKDQKAQQEKLDQ